MKNHLAIAAAVFAGVMLIVSTWLADKNSMLERSLTEARDGQKTAAADLQMIKNLSVENEAKANYAAAKMNILNHMIQESSGLQTLAADLIVELSKLVSLQKGIIERGSSPTDAEESAMRDYEIGIMSSMKAATAYGNRINSLSDEMKEK